MSGCGLSRPLEETEGGTRITVRGQPRRAAAEERELFLPMRANMTQGFGGTFDQLEAFLG